MQLKIVTEMARQELANDLSLNQLAIAAKVSPFHFARLFKNTTGLAPHKFVLRLRLERAKRLIASRQLPLTDIALAVGFFDQAHFTNVFRRAFGMTPKAFAKALS
jgi:AraC family transcriptional regulator